MLRNQKKKSHQKLKLMMNNLKEMMELMQKKTKKRMLKIARMSNKRQQFNQKHSDYFGDYVNI